MLRKSTRVAVAEELNRLLNIPILSEGFEFKIFLWLVTYIDNTLAKEWPRIWSGAVNTIYNLGLNGADTKGLEAAVSKNITDKIDLPFGKRKNKEIAKKFTSVVFNLKKGGKL